MASDQAELRARLSQIDDKIQDQRAFIEMAASSDAQYRMADARIDALKIERNKLLEILGDLP